MHLADVKESVQDYSNIVNSISNRIRIETLGCRLNQIESESTARYFMDAGFSVSMESITSQTAEDSNIYISIINTCTVTQKAEQKARRIIRLLLKKCPSSIVMVTGCYAQVAKDEIEAIDDRICVIGGQIKSRISQIPMVLKKYLENNKWDAKNFITVLDKEILSKPQLKSGVPENSFTLSTSSFLAHSRASLKIQDGCNNNCSYCAIHIARGHSVSIDVQTAIDRVKELELSGQNEVVLTTVNIGQYKGLYKDQYLNFTQLLKLLLENTEKTNFRISSLYPEIVNDDFCEVIKNPRVCPHFHISVQSGSDKILQLMNRQYKSQTVIDACAKIRKVKENPFIACDIITGFPNESKIDFAETMDLCEKCQFAWIHAFPYSERPGTAAALMKGKIPQAESGGRAKRLTEWAINNKINYINSFVGKKLTAIIETVKHPKIVRDNNTFIYHAVTDNFIHCEIITNTLIKESSKVDLLITGVLIERIQKGGDIEASAKIL